MSIISFNIKNFFKYLYVYFGFKIIGEFSMIQKCKKKSLPPFTFFEDHVRKGKQTFFKVGLSIHRVGVGGVGVIDSCSALLHLLQWLTLKSDEIFNVGKDLNLFHTYMVKPSDVLK